MPDVLAPNTTTTAGDGPIVGETPTREFSPAELGIQTEEVQIAPPAPAEESPETPPAELDIVGEALRRGRPPRDLEGLTDEEKELFKNMNRKAYERLYPFYKKFRDKEKDLDELPTLREKLASLEKATPKPASYYDHEDSYLLRQDYRDALLENRQHQSVLNHWQEQLVNLKEGKPIHDLIQDANGNLQLSEPIQPTPRQEAQLLALIAQSQQAYQNHQSKLESLKAASKQEFTQYNTAVKTIHEQLFGKYKDQLGPAAEKLLERFPDFARSRPELQFAAHAYALLQHIVQADKASQAQQGVAKANANGQKVAGPTIRSMTTAPKPVETATSDEEYRQFRRTFNV